jgi:hypothetical protein
MHAVPWPWACSILSLTRMMRNTLRAAVTLACTFFRLPGSPADANRQAYCDIEGHSWEVGACMALRNAALSKQDVRRLMQPVAVRRGGNSAR